MLFDFLWDGKPDKIKRSICKNKIEKGGLGMIDIKLFEKSLKLTWIRRFINSDPKWKIIISTIYPKLEYFWKYGNYYSHILSTTITNPFWSHVFSTFNQFNTNIDVSCLEELAETSFLYNEKVKVANSVVINKSFEQKNVFLIKQLMEHNTFLSYEDFMRKYEINIDFISYNSIVRAIKKSYAFDDLEVFDKIFKYQPSLNIIMKSKKGAMDIYQTFISKAIESKGRDKWISLLGITTEDWESAFFKLKFTTKDTKLRWLQFRLLHNILTTNRSVSKYKEDQTDLCTFCNNQSETIQHLFYSCTVVKQFWVQLFDLINKRCRHANNFKVNEIFILFGESEHMYSDNVCDLILLLAKLFIYRSKVQKSNLVLRNFLKDVHNIYSCEKIIYKNNQKFINRWQPYLDLFKSLL